ncbi:hypothetical protein JOD45_001501 [Scopulibacillus daqui]|uniref:Uncharacterized protein n=1 Tax=Scopulibacillus daqui TaxID=1469162 RepID=A0ABS2PZ28_9BACL|nr:hypothetical protein [Scopulibacillus daqui]
MGIETAHGYTYPIFKNNPQLNSSLYTHSHLNWNVQKFRKTGGLFALFFERLFN